MIEARPPVALESLPPEEAVRILNLFSEFITFMDSRGVLDRPSESILPSSLPEDFVAENVEAFRGNEANTPES